MGFFDWFSVIKRPAPGVPAKTAAEVRADLLAINRPTAPFIIRDGAPEFVDLVGEWRIEDATWYAIFVKAGLKKSFKVLMRIDETLKEVRSIDERRSVEWQAGYPALSSEPGGKLGLSWEKEYGRGQITEYAWGKGYAFTEQGRYGEVYNYRFVSSELKTPLQEAVTKAGWVWRGIAFGGL
jgi:hypothetical protein